MPLVEKKEQLECFGGGNGTPSNPTPKSLFLITFCLILSMTHCAKSNRKFIQNDDGQTYHKIINNFDNWGSYSAGNQVVGFRIDSSDFRNPVHFFQYVSWGFRGKFQVQLGLNSKLLLPYQKKAPKKAKINLTCKSENLKYIKLVTSLFDKRENAIRSDTLFVSNNDNWNTFSKDINLKGSRFFNLALMAEGIDSTYLDNGLSHIDNTCIQNLWIGDIRIELDGKDIDQYSESEILEDCRVNNNNIISIQEESSFSQIPELQKKKIIALGESIHGSEAFNEIFYQLTKYQVKFNQCRLILLEMDICHSLLLNNYIHGNETFDVDSLLYDLRYYSYSTRQLKNVLLFLKDYNKSADNKVYLLGFDSTSEENYFPGITISEYLYALNNTHNYKKIDTVCYELISTDMYKYNGADIKKLEMDTKFRKIIGDLEFKILLYSCNSKIRNYIKKSTPQESTFIRRERWLFENTQYLIDLFSELDKDCKVLIYGHIAHLCYKEETPLSHSFGRCMKDYYGDQYYIISLLANQGFIRSVFQGNFIIKPLRQDIKSIEHSLSALSYDRLYFPIRSVDISHIKIRQLGLNYNENQFRVITPSSRFDAIIYSKNTEAATYWPNVLGTQYNIAILSEQHSRQHQRISQKLQPYKRSLTKNYIQE